MLLYFKIIVFVCVMPKTFIGVFVCLDTTPRMLSPYPAVTAVMRNPVYTAWSHCVKTTNSASVPAHTHAQVRYTHTHTLWCITSVLMRDADSLSVLFSPKHQGRWSVDLNHKRSGELFDGSRGSVQHNTNSLPSSARQGLYCTRHSTALSCCSHCYLMMFCSEHNVH